MKPEDYPLVIYKGERLRVVPELSAHGDDESACNMCIVEHMTGECGREGVNALVDSSCGDVKTIYLPEGQFQEYVVELVRRRIS